MIEIRNFDPNDTFGVIKLSSQTLTEKYSPSLFAYFYETNPDGFIVASFYNKIIGFLIGVKINDQKTKILMISVLPKHQKQKIGTKLLNEFIKRTKKEKINTIELEVRTDNYKAIKFYEKHGFKIMLKRKEFYQDNKDAYTMQLNF